MKEEAKKIEDFDDILCYVGGWGRFQLIITLVNFLFPVYLGYVYLSPILTGELDLLSPNLMILFTVIYLY